MCLSSPPSYSFWLHERVRPLPPPLPAHHSLSFSEKRPLLRNSQVSVSAPPLLPSSKLKFFVTPVYRPVLFSTQTQNPGPFLPLHHPSLGSLTGKRHLTPTKVITPLLEEKGSDPTSFISGSCIEDWTPLTLFEFLFDDEITKLSCSRVSNDPHFPHQCSSFLSSFDTVQSAYVNEHDSEQDTK